MRLLGVHASLCANMVLFMLAAIASCADAQGVPEAVHAGPQSSCATYDGGRVVCFGLGDFGILGQGNEVDIGGNIKLSDVDPIEYPEGAYATQLALGPTHTCAILDTTPVEVLCHGSGLYGMTGQGSTADLGAQQAMSTLPYVNFPGGLVAAKVAVGDSHSCAVMTGGQAICWGFGTDGRLGRGNTKHIADNEDLSTLSYLALPGSATATHVSAGDKHTCLILDSGTPLCFGDNAKGQLGQGNTDDLGDDEAISTLTPINMAVDGVALGSAHTCFTFTLTSRVVCFGDNEFGQLGRGNTATLGDDEAIFGLAAIVLPGSQPVQQLATRRSANCVILEDGTVFCWGKNTFGVLGQGDATEHLGDDEDLSDVPVIALPGSETATEIAVGGTHVCALLASVDVVCWGYGGNGRLGQGNLVNLGDDEDVDTIPPIVLPETIPVEVTSAIDGSVIEFDQTTNEDDGTRFETAGALTHDASFVLTNVVAEEATITSITVTNGDQFAVVEPSDPDADLVLASGDTADLVIRFDSDDATYATYSSTVTINFSDGKQTTFQVQGKHVDEPVIALVTSRSRVLVGTETPSVDLGTRTEIGLEDTWTFTLRIVRQSGNERALTISQITLQDDDEFYELVTPSSTPFVIEEDVDPYTVTVNFLGAASTGTYVLDATIVTDAFDGELDFELRVDVVDLPELQTTTSPSSFPVRDAFLGETWTKTYVLTNVGTQYLDLAEGTIVPPDPLVVLTDTVGGNSSAMFRVAQQPASSTIAVNGSVTIAVQYAPTAAGTHKVSFAFDTNLLSPLVSFSLVGTTHVLRRSTVTVGDGSSTALDLGELVTTRLAYDTSVRVVNSGGLPVQLVNMTASLSGSAFTTIDRTAVGQTIAVGASVVVPVKLTLTDGAQQDVSIVVETTSDVQPLATVSVSLRTRLVPQITPAVGALRPTLAAPLAIAGVPGFAAKSIDVQLVNTGLLSVPFSNVTFEGDVPPGLSLTWPEPAVAGDNVTLARNKQLTVTVRYAPDARVAFDTVASAVVAAHSPILAAPIRFAVSASALGLAWDSSTPQTVDVLEGKSRNVTVLLPVPFAADESILALNQTDATAVLDVDFSVAVHASANGNSAIVAITVKDDLAREDAETFPLELVSGATRTLSIGASDPKEIRVPVGGAGSDPDAPVEIVATGFQPKRIARGTSLATVILHVQPSDLSAPSDVSLVIVEEESSLYADPDFETKDAILGDVESAGNSFAIELDDGVELVNTIEASVRYRCGTDVDDLVLLLRDTSAVEHVWRRYTDLCDTEPPAPTFDEPNCRATFHICHLTQFAIARQLIENDVPVDDSQESGDGLPGGWAAVLGIGLVAVLGLVAFCVRGCYKKDKQAEEERSAKAAAAAELATTGRIMPFSESPRTPQATGTPWTPTSASSTGGPPQSANPAPLPPLALRDIEEDSTSAV